MKQAEQEVTSEHIEAQEMQQQQKKQLDHMLKIMDGMEHESKVEKEKILYDQFISNLKNEEFMGQVEKLKELDFAEGLVL